MAEPIDCHLTLGLYRFSENRLVDPAAGVESSHNREVPMIASSRVPRPVSEWLLIGLVLVSLTFTPYRAATAQDTTTTLTDEGLRQLAEVVDGVRTGELVWVVLCGTQAPYEVLGTFSTAQAADAAATAKSAESHCHVHGPYATTADTPIRLVAYGEICRKRLDSSCAPSDTTYQLQASDPALYSITDVLSVTISYRLRDGRTVTSSTFRPQEGEAVFFTMSAVDKLLIPYLQRVYGVDYAQRARATMLRRTSLRR
jgi:hypothetical protein